MKKTKVCVVTILAIIFTFALVACNAKAGDVYENENSSIEIVTINNSGGTAKFTNVKTWNNGTVNGTYKFDVNSKENGVYKIKVHIDGKTYDETFYNDSEITFCGISYFKK